MIFDGKAEVGHLTRDHVRLMRYLPKLTTVEPKGPAGDALVASAPLDLQPKLREWLDERAKAEEEPVEFDAIFAKFKGVTTTQMRDMLED